MNNRQFPQNNVETANTQTFELITQEYIDQTMRGIRADFSVNLDGVQINMAKPGDALFDRYEIQHKLFHKCDSDFDQLMEKIRSYGYNPEALNTEDLRKIANRESIILEGELPGFAMAAGGDEIIFFAVSSINALEMARKYAEKEGDTDVSLNTIQDAVSYLENLAKKAFFHEVAHIIYSRGDFRDWEEYIQEQQDIQKRVIELQRDKYGDAEQIPIAEEAFADFAIEILSNGKFISRLGINEEATERIRSHIKKKQ